jgi:hypothetical protein
MFQVRSPTTFILGNIPPNRLAVRLLEPQIQYHYCILFNGKSVCELRGLVRKISGHSIGIIRIKTLKAEIKENMKVHQNW